ncbi:UNVERIFIED_CONTAM: hypothetical protein K2H54_041040 [Gekko kuhli]
MAVVFLQTGDVMEQRTVQMTAMKLAVHIPPVKETIFNARATESASLNHGYVMMKKTVKMAQMNINNAQIFMSSIDSAAASSEGELA